MERVHASCWILVLSLSYVVCEKPGFTGRARKTSFSMLNGVFDMPNARGGQTVEFPNELRYTMTMEDEETVDLYLVRDKFLHTPEMISKGIDGTISRRESSLNVAFYRDTNGYGSFACVANTDSNGGFSCSLSALLNMGQETCFVPLGSPDADCGTIEDGEIQYFQENNEDGDTSREFMGSAKVFSEERRRRRAAESPNNETVSDRTKRSIFPEAGFKVVEIAYILDKAMMDFFYARNPGDNTAAESEADLYVTLLTNEMNVYFSTIKEVSNGELDLYVFPSAVVYPDAGSDFSWVVTNGGGTRFIGDSSVDSDIADFINGNEFTDKQWDHAMVLTGLNLYYGSTGNVLGYAYLETICYPSKSKRLSVNEVSSYNIGRIGAHEIGHALGMYHDTTPCPSGQNIMSSYIFSVSDETKDTFYKFSTCSVEDVINHLSLSSRTRCTIDNGFTDEQFRDKFCSGLPGAQVDSLTAQCQYETGWTDSTPCNTPANAIDCYKPFEISCSLQSGGCTDLRYVWQGTSCGTDKVCYRGDCVSSFDICAASTTSTSTTTTSATTTTTPTTTTPTTTTTTPTRTTTTPTRTTTTPTTTTTTPKTSTTTNKPLAPCTCCGIKRNKRRKRCCKIGRRRHNKSSCYCCRELQFVSPPPGFDGPQY